MLAKPPTDRAMMTKSAPSRAAARSVVAVTSMPMERVVTMCLAMVSMGGSDDSSMSVRATEQSWRLVVLAKSARSRGVQWVLPPPTMVIFAVMAAPRSVVFLVRTLGGDARSEKVGGSPGAGGPARRCQASNRTSRRGGERKARPSTWAGLGLGSRRRPGSRSSMAVRPTRSSRRARCMPRHW